MGSESRTRDEGLDLSRKGNIDGQDDSEGSQLRWADRNRGTRGTTAAPTSVINNFPWDGIRAAGSDIVHDHLTSPGESKVETKSTDRLDASR